MQQDAAMNTSVMNTSVTDTAVMNITEANTSVPDSTATAEDESGSLDSPISSINNNNNDDLSSDDSQADPSSTARTRTAAGQNLIATMLFFHLLFSLIG